MKSYIFFMFTLLLSGCVSSSYVTTIGAKAVHGKTTKESTEINLGYSERFTNFFGDGFLPYTNLYADSEMNQPVTAAFNYDDIVWEPDKYKEGSIKIELDGEKYKFKVQGYPNQVEVVHDYREWYSYPAQSLLVLTMPLDIVILVVAVPIYGIVLLTYAIAMEPPMH